MHCCMLLCTYVHRQSPSMDIQSAALRHVTWSWRLCNKSSSLRMATPPSMGRLLQRYNSTYLTARNVHVGGKCLCDCIHVSCVSFFLKLPWSVAISSTEDFGSQWPHWKSDWWEKWLMNGVYHACSTWYSGGVRSGCVWWLHLSIHSLIPFYNSRKGWQHSETDHARKWHKNHYIQVSAPCTFVEVYPLSHIRQGLLVGACNYIH